MTFAGELVTEELEYDGGRQVTAYLPPDSPEAVVFAGDGQLISRSRVSKRTVSSPEVRISRRRDALQLFAVSPWNEARFSAASVRSGTRLPRCFSRSSS